jgi:hypothetical protein
LPVFFCLSRSFGTLLRFDTDALKADSNCLKLELLLELFAQCKLLLMEGREVLGQLRLSASLSVVGRRGCGKHPSSHFIVY